MGYCEVWQPYREAVKERYPLVLERLEQIETAVPGLFSPGSVFSPEAWRAGKRSDFRCMG